MAHFDHVKGLAAAYLASPQGQETIRKYLTSPEGQASINAFLATPQGQQMARLLLTRALDGLALPENVKEAIRKALAEKG